MIIQSSLSWFVPSFVSLFAAWLSAVCHTPVRGSPIDAGPASIQFLHAGVELVVTALLLKQIVVITALDDLTVFKNHYSICVADRRETMGNDKCRAILHQSVHTVLNVALGTGIDGTRRFVEDEDRSFGKRRAGDVQKLTLTLGKVRAVALKLRVVAVRQTHDEAVRRCGLISLTFTPSMVIVPWSTS